MDGRGRPEAPGERLPLDAGGEDVEDGGEDLAVGLPGPSSTGCLGNQRLDGRPEIRWWKEAGVDRADAILAVTDDDKTNLLASVRAKQAGCPMAIALINDPTLIPLMEPLNIDAYINPRTTTVSSILRHIRHGRVRGVYSIGDAEAEIIEAQVLSTSPISGRMIRDIDFPEGALVGAVQRGGKVFRPSGGTRIEDGDAIVIFALTPDVPAVEALLQVSIDFF